MLWNLISLRFYRQVTVTFLSPENRGGLYEKGRIDEAIAIYAEIVLRLDENDDLPV
ncbi:hypothetical protein AGMMS50225_28280 [Betaproteobacteria bacterium]|nr:hypothetical protein AGMMS50225_28280 [Betaproteobacteria bacterium]